MGAVELAGQGIVTRQLDELLVVSVTLVVDADDALRAGGLAVGAGKPAAGLLDPEQGSRCRGAHVIFDSVGSAIATMGGGRERQCLAADRALRLDQLGELRSAGQRLCRVEQENSYEMVAPADGIA